MKKIIPFKKDLFFKTKISEITSISLEHSLNLKEDSIISGEFHINGEYKMTEVSVNKEKFDFQLPFDIALDSRYNIDEIKIDIDDFYYEIINNDTLKVHIDVYIDGPVLQEEPIVEEKTAETIEKNIEYEEKEVESVLPKDTRAIENINDFIPNINDIKNEVIETLDNNLNIFDNNTNETYITYKVYIVHESDTIETIINKYNVTKEALEEYNDLSEIKIGDKIIIPITNE